jgi:hypothetical protein
MSKTDRDWGSASSAGPTGIWGDLAFMPATSRVLGEYGHLRDTMRVVLHRLSLDALGELATASATIREVPE